MVDEPDKVPLHARLEERQRTGRLALSRLAESERLLGYFHPSTVDVRRLITDMRGCVATYDPIGVAYGRLSAEELAEAARECAPFCLAGYLAERGVEPGTFDDQAAASAVLRDVNDRIVVESRRLVAKNDWLTILRCARRMPRRWIETFLTQVTASTLDAPTLDQVSRDFPLLAANLALDGLPGHAEQPPESTGPLLDGVRLALLCALHCWHTYMLNTAVRWQVFGSAGNTDPVKSYVRRLQRDADAKAEIIAHFEAGNGPGIAVMTTRRAVGRTTVRLTASKRLEEQLLTLDHYLPVTIPTDRDQRWYGYLTHPNAAPHLGNLPFERWWCCWLALNATARWWLQSWAVPERSDAADSAERERLRLHAEAHNLGMIEVDRNRLRQAVLEQRATEAPTEAEYDAFMASLMWRAGVQRPEFIESPAVFYPSSPETVFWDLLRHGGVVPGLARRISRQRGGLGEHVGAYFEGRVHAALANHRAVDGLRSDVLVRDRTRSDHAIQIDHGFILGDLLVLVESKSYVKTAGYLVANDVGFRTRAESVRRVLPGRDAKLRELSDLIAKEWESQTPCRALYIVCTAEIEYTASRDPELWLDLTRDIPRVCTLSELLEWLDNAEPTTVAAHPASVRLTTVQGT